LGRVVHFEVSADDPERVARFFENVFSWKIERWKGPIPYWLVSTGDGKEPGIDGGIENRREPGYSVVNSIDVADIDDTMKKIEKHGGTIVTQKMDIPGVGVMAYFRDTEGNLHSAMQAYPRERM
jgi:predicted enzyme related to lactoylglutathione lyase